MTVQIEFKLASTLPTREERKADMFRHAADAIEREFEQMERANPTEGRAQ